MVAAVVQEEAAPLQRLQRARGAVRITSRAVEGRSLLSDLWQDGSAKAFFPGRAGATLDGVLVNTAGGLTDGDRFDVEAAAGASSHLVLTTQAAERAYRARRAQPAEVTVRLHAGEGALLDWLPQETILFDGASLRRRFEVDLAGDARFLAVESVVFGRAARGETITRLDLGDQWRIRRDGALVFADALRLEGASARTLERSALLAGAGAVASVFYVAPNAEGYLDAVRGMLSGEAGASAVRPGVLVIRTVARDALEIRRAIVPVLARLRNAPLPRMWSL